MQASPLAVTDVREGDVLAGKYRVERVLGAGGMGVVVAAHHVQLDERVALKFLRPEALAHPDAVARFDREARAVVKIKSEHVARVSDVGRLDNGAPYMVMEYLEGEDLAVLVQQRGPLQVEQAVDFMLQACEAIAEAHSLGIVHRDLKPSNLFCIRRPHGQLSVKVLDFGISKVSASDGSDLGMTRTATVVGSPLYMSPEQMKSAKGVDARTDIWSIGVILYELLCGAPPFSAESLTELAIKVATEEPAPLRLRSAHVPPGLERVILRCLEKDRERRFRNVGELAAALAEFGSKQGEISLERIVGVIQTGQTSPTALTLLEGQIPSFRAAASDRTPSWSRTGAKPARSLSITPTTAAVSAVLLALLVAGAILARRPLASQPTGEPAQAGAQAGTLAPSPPAPSTVADPASAPSASIASADSTERPPPPPNGSSTATPGRRLPATRPTATAAATTTGPATAARATPHCDPPYYFDAKGNRVFKPECL
jgi:serine/threonine-protein kinase